MNSTWVVPCRQLLHTTYTNGSGYVHTVTGLLSFAINCKYTVKECWVQADRAPHSTPSRSQYQGLRQLQTLVVRGL